MNAFTFREKKARFDKNMMFHDITKTIAKIHRVAPVALSGGNTKTPSNSEKKRQTSKQAWCFTWNHYPKNYLDLMAPTIDMLDKYVFGEEVAPKNGTPHLQGYVFRESKFRPIEYLKWPEAIHWEGARGNPRQNFNYCSKDWTNVKFKGIKPERQLPELELYGWQLDIANIVETEPDPRKIHWIWSTEGKKGKSTMAKWLCRQGGLICSGKAADMKYLVLKYKEKTGDFPEILVFDVPRSMENYLSYTGLEELKNGLFCSTKYECASFEMPHPHEFVFANFAPDMFDKDMSSDRFEVTCLD